MIISVGKIFVVLKIWYFVFAVAAIAMFLIGYNSYVLDERNRIKKLGAGWMRILALIFACAVTTFILVEDKEFFLERAEIFCVSVTMPSWLKMEYIVAATIVLVVVIVFLVLFAIVSLAAGAKKRKVRALQKRRERARKRYAEGLRLTRAVRSIPVAGPNLDAMVIGLDGTESNGLEPAKVVEEPRSEPTF